MMVFLKDILKEKENSCHINSFFLHLLIRKIAAKTELDYTETDGLKEGWS